MRHTRTPPASTHDLRTFFRLAATLMRRYDDLSGDIRGYARREQDTIARTLHVLPLLQTRTKAEHGIAVKAGLYIPKKGQEGLAALYQPAAVNEGHKTPTERRAALHALFPSVFPVAQPLDDLPRRDDGSDDFIPF